MSFVRSLRFLVLATIAVAAQAQTLKPAASASGPGSTAELIKVSPQIKQLEKLSASTSPPDRWQILWLHQYIAEQVLAASLQVDATMAQIDNEVARANEIRGFLADHRDRVVGRTNLLSVLVGGTVGATSSGLQLATNLNKPAAGVGIAAGTLSAGLALAGIHQQKGGSSPFAFESNMLAEFFDRPTVANSRYPPTIWAFLNQASAPDAGGLTRKEQLLQTWIQVKRIESLANTQKIDRVTSQPSESLKLTIDDFEDRGAMLQDVRARISYLKRDLGVLIASLPPVSNSL